MRPTLTLIKREFTAYFLSPIAYVVLAVFLLVTGHLFYLTLNLLTESGPRGVEFPMQAMLGDEKFWLVFLFIPPLLTMRLFAEERGTGTLEMLMTAPIRDWQVVMAKFIACFLFYLVMWLPTLIYVPVLVDLRSVDFAWQWTNAAKAFVISLGVIVLYLLMNMGGFGPGLRFILMALLSLGALAVYLFVLNVYPLPQVANLDLGKEWVQIAVKAGLVVLAFLGLFVLPYALVRLFGDDADGAVLFIGWVQLVFLIVLAAVNFVRIGDEGVFRPVSINTGIDSRPLVVSYSAAVLAGAMFLALGLFVSSLVRSQMVAALVSLLLSLLFIVGGFWRPEMDPSSLLYRFLYYVSVPLHFSQNFTRGIVDTGNVVLYLSVTVFFLFLTVRSLESRRWK